jgi:hypothetical protein
MIPRMRARVAIALALSSLAAGALTGAADAAAPPRSDGGKVKGKDGVGAAVRSYPWESRENAARRFARRRAGVVSFAVIDERGGIHAHRRGTRYSSASVVKAMLLVAYLRRVGGARVHGGERALLGPMIRRSDNAAASAIRDRVGNEGLARLARRAGMRRFIPSEVWGGSQITARDQARFFFRIRSLVPKRHRSYAMGLLRRIVPGQRWGVPQGKPKGWRAFFKGGWTPSGGGWRVHQAALLRRGKRKLAVVVLTEGNPSFGYGQRTIAGVTSRLLKRYPSAKR